MSKLKNDIEQALLKEAEEKEKEQQEAKLFEQNRLAEVERKRKQIIQEEQEEDSARNERKNSLEHERDELLASINEIKEQSEADWEAEKVKLMRKFEAEQTSKATKQDQALEKIKAVLEESKAKAAILAKEVKIARDKQTQLEQKNAQDCASAAKLVTPEPQIATEQYLTKFDEPRQLSSLISSITEENQRRAKEAHNNSLQIICGMPHFTPGVNPLAEISSLDQDSTGANIKPVSNYNWALLSRRVRGPTEALYANPMENPYWEYNQRKHEIIKDQVLKEVSRRKSILYQHWTMLACEYMVHHNNWKMEKGEDEDETDEEEPTTSNEDTTRRSSRNSGTSSHRRPRRGAGTGFYIGGTGDVVRTEYEQELILKDIAEREARERRIKFGGCAIPRQIGKLERVCTLQLTLTALTCK